MTQTRKRRLTMRRTNRCKCLLCYLISFALPLVWQAVGIRLIYPYKLASTAPAIAKRLSTMLPFCNDLLLPLVNDTVSAQETPAMLQAALQALEVQWLAFVTGMAALAWLLTLVFQLCWRARHSRSVLLSRATRRAIRNYRLMLLCVLLFNAAVAWALWWLGVSLIAGPTLWDWLCYFPVYLLNPLSAMLVSRLAASSAISGKHAFFKRL